MFAPPPRWCHKLEKVYWQVCFYKIKSDNVFDFSTLFFILTCHVLKTWFELKLRVRLYRNKSHYGSWSKWSAGRQKFFELWGGSSYPGYNCCKCIKETRGKSTLIQVSARFESSGVNLVVAPDLQMRWGGGGHPDPKIRGGPVSKQNFFGPSGLNLV